MVLPQRTFEKEDIMLFRQKIDRPLKEENIQDYWAKAMVELTLVVTRS